MTSTRRYIKELIHEALLPDGGYAKDLVDPVSQKNGKPVSTQKICNYLHVMHDANEVRREPEMKFSSVLRYKWYTNRATL